MNAKANTDHVEEQDLELEEAAQIEQDIEEADQSRGRHCGRDADQVEPDLIGEPDGLCRGDRRICRGARSRRGRQSDERRQATQSQRTAGSPATGRTGRRNIRAGGRWYVIHTYSGTRIRSRRPSSTASSRSILSDKSSRSSCRPQEEIEIKNGQRQTVQQEGLPRLCAGRMAMDDDTWYVAAQHAGRDRLRQLDNKPVPLDETRSPDDPEGHDRRKRRRSRSALRWATRVRIIDGPFADFRGEIDEINHEKGKIRVLVSFFGRETPVELDFLQAERET